MRLLVTPTFERAVKKLHPKQKSELDEAVRTIVNHPECGEAKVGDRQGFESTSSVYQTSCACWLTVFSMRIA